MKRKTIALLLVTLSLASMMGFTGCAKKNATVQQSSNVESNSTASNVSTEAESAETVSTEKQDSSASSEAGSTNEHVHSYKEAVTKESSCTEDGERTFTCECGDSYREVISALGHQFTSYTFNEDATYMADGTETATCVCGEKDTRTKVGTMLTFTYTDLTKTMYAKSAVNVRSLPSTEGERIGGLNTNDEVQATGVCNETGWYRFSLNGITVYVSDKYLVDNKIVVQNPVVASNNAHQSVNEAVPQDTQNASEDNASEDNSSDSSSDDNSSSGGGNLTYWGKVHTTYTTDTDAYIDENGNITYSYVDPFGYTVTGTYEETDTGWTQHEIFEDGREEIWDEYDATNDPWF